jgi:hypothetical protein
MKRITPHIILFGLLAAIVGYGIFTNSGSIGTIIGTSAAISTDPLVLASGLVVGLFSRRYLKFLLIATPILLVVSVVIQIDVSEYMAELGISESRAETNEFIVWRALVALTLAHLTNFLLVIIFPIVKLERAETKNSEHAETIKESDGSEDVLKVWDEAVKYSSDGWLAFRDRIKFKDNVPLFDEITAALPPISMSLERKFSELGGAPGGVFFMILASGIVMSGTHSKSEVESAIGAPIP